MTVKEELDEMVDRHTALGHDDLVIYLGARARADLKASLTTRPEMGVGRLDGYRGYPISASKDPDAVSVVPEGQGGGGSRLVDDTRNMGQLAPWSFDHDGRRCFYCDAVLEDTPGLKRGHRSNCPWLSLPRIIEALEAAERVRMEYEHVDWDAPDDLARSLEALATALRGDEV